MAKNNGSSKRQMTTDEKKGLIVGIVIAIVVLYGISPWLLLTIGIIVFGLFIWRVVKKMNAADGTLEQHSAVVQPRLNSSNYKNEDFELPPALAREIDELPALDVVKHKLRRLAVEAGASELEDLLVYEETPDVLKRYITEGRKDEFSGSSSGFESHSSSVSGFFGKTEKKSVDEDGCHVSDDDLYDSGEYESVNALMSNLDSDTILLNGKPVKFKNNGKPVGW